MSKEESIDAIKDEIIRKLKETIETDNKIIDGYKKIVELQKEMIEKQKEIISGFIGETRK